MVKLDSKKKVVKKVDKNKKKVIKRVVKKNIQKLLGGGVKVVDPLNRPGVGGNTLRDGVMMNRMMGLTPQNMNVNPQLAAIQGRAEASEKIAFDLNKEVQMYKDKQKQAEIDIKKRERERADLKKNEKGLEVKVTKAVKDENKLEDLKEKIKNLEKEIWDHTIPEGKITEKQLELTNLKNEREELERQNMDMKVRIDENKWLNLKREEEFKLKRLQNENQALLQVLGQIPEDTVLEDQVKNIIVQQRMEDDKRAVTEEALKIQRNVRKMQIENDALNDPMRKLETSESLAIIQKNLEAEYQNQANAEQELYDRKIEYIPFYAGQEALEHEKKRTIKLKNESDREAMKGTQLNAKYGEIGQMTKEAMRKGALAEVNKSINEWRSGEREKSLKTIRESTKMDITNKVWEDVMNDDYKGNDKRVWDLKNELQKYREAEKRNYAEEVALDVAKRVGDMNAQRFRAVTKHEKALAQKNYNESGQMLQDMVANAQQMTEIVNMERKTKQIEMQNKAMEKKQKAAVAQNIAQTFGQADVQRNIEEYASFVDDEQLRKEYQDNLEFITKSFTKYKGFPQMFAEHNIGKWGKFDGDFALAVMGLDRDGMNDLRRDIDKTMNYNQWVPDEEDEGTYKVLRFKSNE